MVPKVSEEPATITVWTGGRRFRNRTPPWVFVEGTRRLRGSPPRVSIEDATLEVCAGGDSDHVAASLAAAVSSRRTTPDRLRARAAELVNLRNRGLVLEMLGDVGGGVESPLESRYLHDVEKRTPYPKVCVRSASVRAPVRTSPTLTRECSWNSTVTSGTRVMELSGTPHVTTATRSPVSPPCGSVGTTWPNHHARSLPRWRQC